MRKTGSSEKVFGNIFKKKLTAGFSPNILSSNPDTRASITTTNPHDNTPRIALLNAREKDIFLNLKDSFMSTLLSFTNKRAGNNIKNISVMNIPKNIDLSWVIEPTVITKIQLIRRRSKASEIDLVGSYSILLEFFRKNIFSSHSFFIFI